MKAARVVSAEPTTVGHAREPTVPVSQVSIESTCGNTIRSSGRRLCFDLEQVVHVGDAHLRREARVDRAALGEPSLYSSSEVKSE
jgi:hypothetical protein